jgi:thymidine kinase
MNNQPIMSGYLEIILGPMFSGKTSKILEVYKQCMFSNISVVAINHISDNRYSETMISTHDKQMIPCLQTTRLYDLFEIEIYKNRIQTCKVILINEGQFFEDLYDWVVEMVEVHKKEVYVCGLDGDFNRNKFGTILDLIPHCDKVNKLKSLCSICKDGTKALFSLRMSHETQQVLIGSDCYKPVCRRCYNCYKQ